VSKKNPVKFKTFSKPVEVAADELLIVDFNSDDEPVVIKDEDDG
jgi:hypothetical protein